MAAKKDAPKPPDAALSPAESFVAGLSEAVEAFQSELEETESVLAFYVTPGGEPIQVESIGALAPEAVVFQGTDSDGLRTLAIVPMSQAHLTVKATLLGESEEGEPPRRIGFLTSRDRIVEDVPAVDP